MVGKESNLAHNLVMPLIYLYAGQFVAAPHTFPLQWDFVELQLDKVDNSNSKPTNSTKVLPTIVLLAFSFLNSLSDII